MRCSSAPTPYIAAHPTPAQPHGASSTSLTTAPVTVWTRVSATTPPRELLLPVVAMGMVVMLLLLLLLPGGRVIRLPSPSWHLPRAANARGSA